MIDKLSDQEKSVMLAKAMGWTALYWSNRDFWSSWYHLVDENNRKIKRRGIHKNTGDVFHSLMVDLYKPSNMALAWRVLNWAHETGLCRRYADGVGKNIHFWDAPADAQRAWLDKILTLAIEAGLVAKPSDKP